MEERGRGKRNMHSEKNKDERDRQLEAMTEEERDEYFREMRRERRLRRQKRERRSCRCTSPHRQMLQTMPRRGFSAMPEPKE